MGVHPTSRSLGQTLRVGAAHVSQWTLLAVLTWFSRVAVAILFCGAMVSTAVGTRTECEAGLSVKGEKDVSSTKESEDSIHSDRRAQRGLYAKFARDRRAEHPPRAIEPRKRNAPRPRWRGPRRTGSDDEDDEASRSARV